MAVVAVSIGIVVPMLSAHLQVTQDLLITGHNTQVKDLLVMRCLDREDFLEESEVLKSKSFRNKGRVRAIVRRVSSFFQKMGQINHQAL